MFISQKDAEARLAHGRNIFRDPGLPVVPDPDPAEESESITDSPEKDEKPEEMLDLSELDALINPESRRTRRANYRGNLEAQVGIAETSLILSQQKAADIFGMSRSQVEAYQRGLQSSNQITDGTPPKPALKQRVDAIKEEIAEKSALRLKNVLDLLDEPKLKQVKRATNLAKIGKDMATILDKVAPANTGEGHVHFHVFAPERKDISDYKVVSIGGGKTDAATGG
jgi:transposase